MYLKFSRKSVNHLGYWLSPASLWNVSSGDLGTNDVFLNEPRPPFWSREAEIKVKFDM